MGVSSSNDRQALDALFRNARAEPSGEHLHRVKQRLHALAREAETPRGRSARGSSALLSCLVVVGFGLMPAPRETTVAHAATPLAMAPAPAPAPTPTPTPTLAAPSTAPSPEVTRTVPVEALAPAEQATTVEPARVIPAERARVRRPALAQEPQAVAAPAVVEAPIELEEKLPRTTTSPTNAPVAAPAADEVARAEGEASFLRRAKIALSTEPARALAMTDEHPARYPRGALLQEREVIAIDALIRLGRAHDARARAASFRARYPTSAHHGHLDGKIERLLDGAARDARR